MVDLSAAFDLVDHGLLVKKLEVMGFNQNAVAWFRSYLADRQQCVQIDGKFSEFRNVDTGVPQGSVLGALLYILYVNELPEVIQILEQTEFREDCTECGHLCCYVDDSTLTVTSDNADELSRKLTVQYRLLADFFGDNKLVINNEKTHLIVMGSRKHRNIRREVEVNTGSILVKPSESEKLLGLNIHQSLKWREHIQDGNCSMLISLNRKLIALKKIAVNASFKTRLLVANACFQSVLLYMIPVWGGADNYLLNALQMAQNRAARIVTKMTWFTPTRTLLKQCNWLNIKQLVFFHTAIQMWKIINFRSPTGIYKQLQLSRTRSNAYGTLAINHVQSALGRQSFIARGSLVWNQIPVEIRTASKVDIFRKKLRPWILKNIDND